MASDLENEPPKPFDIDVSSVPTYYINQFAMAFWPEEVALSFGRRRMSNGSKGDEVLKIYASHATIKRLAHDLLDSIQQYEENFGDIHTEIVDRLTPEAKAKFGFNNDTE